MEKINIIGNILGSSGYVIHTKYLAQTLQEQGYDVRLDCPLNQGWERQVTDSELNMLTKPFDEDCTSIFIGQPPFWRFGLSDNPKHFIGYLVWEGVSIPEYWLEYLCDERVEQIWVPSNHVKEAIENKLTRFFKKEIIVQARHIKYGKIINKVKIVPHGVDLTIFNENKIKKTKHPFTFITNKGWRGGIEDRGGVQYLLKAYCEEFKHDEDVRLIVKLNPSYLSPDFDFRKELENLGLNKEESAPILFNGRNIQYSDMYNFYNEGDVFICPTRAEGFNIPGLEAKAMGLTTIQTGFGGQTDYMVEDTDIKIKYKLDYSKEQGYEGIKWATPDIEDLKRVMRECYNNKEKIYKKSKKSIEQSKLFSWQETGKKAKKFIEELQ